MQFVNGQPCWVDIMVPDAATQQVCTQFLTDLLGLRWEIGGPETGHYGMGFLGRNAVLAVGVRPQGQGQPTVFLKADDIEATVAAVAAAGGTITMPPMQVMEAGTLAMAVDPTGAVVGMWQPNLMRGFGVLGAPGAFTWFDLSTHDVPAAAAFYQRAFGLGFTPTEVGGMLTQGGMSVASISQAPEGRANAWTPIVRAADLEAFEGRAASLGCAIRMRRMQVPGGQASAVEHPALGLVVTAYLPGAEA